MQLLVKLNGKTFIFNVSNNLTLQDFYYLISEKFSTYLNLKRLIPTDIMIIRSGTKRYMNNTDNLDDIIVSDIFNNNDHQFNCDCKSTNQIITKRLKWENYINF